MAVTTRDIILRALEDCGVIGVGQTPAAEDMNYGLARFNSMLGQMNRRRWLIWHTVDVACQTTGLNVYSVGLGGNFNIPMPDRLEDGCYFRQYFTGGAGSPNSNSPFGWANGNVPPSNKPFSPDFNSDFGSDYNSIPTVLVSQPNGYAVDYPLTLLQSREDWNRIALKNMPSWPAYVFYDPANTSVVDPTSITAANPTGNANRTGFLYINPVPYAGQFELHILVKDVMQTVTDLSADLIMPPEYEEYLEFQLALRFCVKYQIDASKELIGLARAAGATIRSANNQIPSLGLPVGLTSQGARYNIYSDRSF